MSAAWRERSHAPGKEEDFAASSAGEMAEMRKKSGCAAWDWTSSIIALERVEPDIVAGARAAFVLVSLGRCKSPRERG